MRESVIYICQTLQELLGHSFNIRSCYVPLDNTMFLWSWYFGVCCDKKQVPCENQCGTGNKDDSVQSDSKIWNTVQCPISIHLLISVCGYLRMT